LSAIAGVLTGSVGYLELSSVVFVFVFLVVIGNLYRFHSLLGAKRGKLDLSGEDTQP
jgi:hypothetical protein